jgi:hypothetical protein
MRTWNIGAALGIAISVGSSGAFAQAGATGGTLGNTDKSISGEREEPRRSGDHATEQQQPSSKTRQHSARREITARPSEAHNSCGKFVGTWAWTHIGTISVTFSSNGTAEASNGRHGSWGCASGVLSVTWDDGLTYRLAISTDGRSSTVLPTYSDYPYPECGISDNQYFLFDMRMSLMARSSARDMSPILSLLDHS